MSNVLFNLAQAYLNQGVPSIDPIFQAGSSTQQFQPIVPQVASGLTPEQLLLLQQQQIAQTPGRDDDDKTGFGLFGYLDPNTEQTVYREVYDEEVGDFVPTELKVYRNVKTGALQTFEGKNVDGLLTDVPTGGALSIFDSIFGPKTVGGYRSGKIRGKYDTISDLMSKNRNKIITQDMTPQGKMRITEGIKIAEDTPGGGEFSTPSGGGIQSIQTRRSAGDIGSRVSRSYREDPNTGLL
tara:strand:- start:122 stop:838 length:717 start_codon:yes stop_codon:yes gene_type:complete